MTSFEFSIFLTDRSVFQQQNESIGHWVDAYLEWMPLEPAKAEWPLEQTLLSTDSNEADASGQGWIDAYVEWAQVCSPARGDWAFEEAQVALAEWMETPATQISRDTTLADGFFHGAAVDTRGLDFVADSIRIPA